MPSIRTLDGLLEIIGEHAEGILFGGVVISKVCGGHEWMVIRNDDEGNLAYLSHNLDWLSEDDCVLYDPRILFATVFDAYDHYDLWQGVDAYQPR